MPTSGQTNFIRSNISSYIAFLFIGTYVLGVGLVLWYAAFRSNPITDILTRGMETPSLQ